MNAIDLIKAERERQVSAEGWTPEHDDQHPRGEMAMAAASYAFPPQREPGDTHEEAPPDTWPWETEWWKPCPNDRLRELVKAGALLAAEIDRELRLIARFHAARGLTPDQLAEVAATYDDRPTEEELKAFPNTKQ